ncbi:natural killer cells antigen CD94-like [Lissotriton helveticus]
MESDVTYVDLKFTSNVGKTSKLRSALTETSPTQKKTVQWRCLAVSALVICFLLLATLIALIIMYSLMTARLQQLQISHSRALMYIGCKDKPSDTDCKQYFTKSCPKDWLQNNSQCYYFSVVESWHQKSRENCKLNESFLVSILDRQEQDFITRNKGPHLYWIGLTDFQEEGTWKWLNGSALQKDRFWRCDQPDKEGDKGKEDCATLGSSPCDEDSILHNWSDENCWEDHRYICKKKAMEIQKEFVL